jgi:uncharacterized membrane protein
VDKTGTGQATGAHEDDESTVGGDAEPLLDPTRLLALSDGVFAIVITLLVLDVHVPELSQGQTLAQALEETRPSLIAFVISFMIAGIYWVGHRDIFALIRRTDRGIVWLNLLYLLPLCLLPFAASLVGRYTQEPVALRIYGLLLLVIAVMRTVIWAYITGHPQLLWGRVGVRQRQAGLALAIGPAVAYLVALIVAGVLPLASLAIYAFVPVLYFISTGLLRRRRPGIRLYADFT